MAELGYRTRSPPAPAVQARVLSEACRRSRVTMYFGSSGEFEIPEGSGSLTRQCPPGSANLAGEVHFNCLPSGLWNLSSHDCYACPGGELTLMYRGRERDIKLPPGLQDEAREESCTFKDGTSYRRGKLKFRCSNKRWRHVGTTCSNTLCPDSSVAIVSEGTKLELPLPGSDSSVFFGCPDGQGTMEFGCTRSSEDDSWRWKLKNSTCAGVIRYTAPSGMCPSTIATVKMKYLREPVKEASGQVQIHAAHKGVHSYPCPSEALDPTGTITFQCTQASLWEVLRIECGGGAALPLPSDVIELG